MRVTRLKGEKRYWLIMIPIQLYGLIGMILIVTLWIPQALNGKVSWTVLYNAFIPFALYLMLKEINILKRANGVK